MTAALKNGRIRAHVLGMGIDPSPSLLTCQL
jgi:hypothetical protein